MAERIDPLRQRVQIWFESARAAGWLEDDAIAQLDALEQGGAADLFEAGGPRPLVVAFFGGTGVGKSSLLNRLAAAELSKTGVERPTSHELTLFVHESVALADLPPELPLDRVRIRTHAGAADRGVLWIDAPDIDSTAEANRRLALACLPHVDLLCYVVSPERYRDDAGWRVLRERGERHGWIFVMNRWDEGDPRQLDDFRRMLAGAGFERPILLATSCALPPRPLPSADEFVELRTAIDELISSHGAAELERVGLAARRRDLRRVLSAAAAHLGDEPAWRAQRDLLANAWPAVCRTILDGVEWSLRAAAARVAIRDSDLLGRLGRQLSALRGSTAPAAPRPESRAALPPAEVQLVAEHGWDAWTRSKLDACLDLLEVSAARGGLAAGPLRARLDAAAAAAEGAIPARLAEGVRMALARPGTAAQRGARRVTGFLCAFLPGLALVAVAWQVASGYFYAAAGQRPFLGTEFAVHSALLVLVAWAVPFILDRALRPSVERAVYAALRDGLRGALDDMGAQLAAALDETAADAAERRAAAGEISAALEPAGAAREPAARPEIVRRVVARGAMR